MTSKGPVYPRLSALFIGAHPDDIEIGSAGTIAKLVQIGWDVHCCVLTSEQDTKIAQTRENEARKAGHTLGVPSGNIFFMHFPDSFLESTGETVGSFRKVLHDKKLNPDLIFTHTQADSHNDHRAAYNLVVAAFRKKPILNFAVVNSLIRSNFKPQVFIETADYLEAKKHALILHKSQSTRIDADAITVLNDSFAKRVGLDSVEPFEVTLQEGSEDLLYLVLGLNDSPFHNFWYPLLREQSLCIVHSVPVYRNDKKYDWPAFKEQEGIELFYETFSRLWYDSNPVRSKSSENHVVDELLHTSNILLSGSGVSNRLTRDCFEHFKGLRYHVNYAMPDYQNLSIYDDVTSRTIRAEYYKDATGTVMPRIDYGILTIQRNPLNERRNLIGCMGIHGFGTLACFHAISNNILISKLLSFIHFPLRHPGYQVIVEYDIQQEKATIIEDSWHVIQK